MRRGKYKSSPFVTRVRELVPSLQTWPITSIGTDRPVVIKDLKEDVVREGVYRCGWEVFRGYFITESDMPRPILTTLTLTLLTLGNRWAFVPAFLSWRHEAISRTNSTKEEWLADTYGTSHVMCRV